VSEESEVLVRRQGAAGIIVLNRPKALNALTQTMVREMDRALKAWERDPAVTRIVVKGAGERAFCAGGDIRALHDLGKAGRQAEALAFWREEYILNRYIKRYPKPYVALIDGIVMGGGVGVSLHGSHRVAGDRIGFAMPEVGIGFFPDVGATYALPRLPFRAGSYLALTGQRIGRADALALGIATHGVASVDFPAVEAGLIAGDDIDTLLKAHESVIEPSPLVAHKDIIERAFGGSSVRAILTALDAEALASEFARAAAATMRTKSPLSMAIALEQMRRGSALTFEEAMTMEMRIVTRVAAGHEFYEGVRALIIDKDQKPAWRPASVDGVDPVEVATYFAPLPDDLIFA